MKKVKLTMSDILTISIKRLNGGGLNRLLITTIKGNTYICGHKQQSFRFTKNGLTKVKVTWKNYKDDLYRVENEHGRSPFFVTNIGLACDQQNESKQIMIVDSKDVPW